MSFKWISLGNGFLICKSSTIKYCSIIKHFIQDQQCSGKAWELRQTLSVVFDLYTSGQGKKGKGTIPFFF